MNGYKCFWNRRTIEVQADTSYAAQQLAVAEFQKSAGRRKVKGHDVSVVLCEKSGEQVTHSTASIG